VNGAGQLNCLTKLLQLGLTGEEVAQIQARIWCLDPRKSLVNGSLDLLRDLVLTLLRHDPLEDVGCQVTQFLVQTLEGTFKALDASFVLVLEEHSLQVAAVKSLAGS
jgi:hypothetical protein